MSLGPPAARAIAFPVFPAFLAFLLLTASAADCLADGERGSGTKDRWAAERESFSRSLIREGDLAYRRLRYAQARRAYGDAAANLPGAYAYIMYGDARWRELLQAQQHLRREEMRRHENCSLRNEDMAQSLRMELPQTHERGLAMAQHAARAGLPAASFLRQAEETAGCLRRLIADYEKQPGAACADLAPLQRCLGRPLRSAR